MTTRAVETTRGLRPGHRARGLHASAVTVLVVGSVATVVLSLGALGVHNNNEDRLLQQRAREVAAVVAGSLPNVETPLQTAALVAETTHGNADAFTRIMTPIVAAGRPFVSASLWNVQRQGGGRSIVVGKPLELAARARPAVFQRAAHSHGLVVDNLLAAPDRRLGYAFTSGNPTAHYVVYAEAALPAGRRATIDKNSAFSDFGYALFLGDRRDAAALLASSTGNATVRGRTAAVTVPFGNTRLLMVLHPLHALGGSLLARLPLMLAIAGLLLTATATWLVEGLTRRRLQAQELAEDNEQLANTERSVAQALQHSLLPPRLPDLPGLDVAARYVAGTRDIDVGGDWYDVMPLKDGRTLVVVGDVSGRGLEAATIMASLRFATRAYAAQGDSPATILTRLDDLVDLDNDGHFATVLCAVIDDHHVTFANAGHLLPLQLADHAVEPVHVPTATPIGVRGRRSYEETLVRVLSGATLLLYTDGLIERRDEDLDASLERLKRSAESLETTQTLSVMVDALLARMIAGGADDDTALLAIRFTGEPSPHAELRFGEGVAREHVG